MKKLMMGMVLLMTLVLAGCSSTTKPITGKCHIMGTINPKFNG